MGHTIWIKEIVRYLLWLSKPIGLTLRFTVDTGNNGETNEGSGSDTQAWKEEANTKPAPRTQHLHMNMYVYCAGGQT